MKKRFSMWHRGFAFALAAPVCLTPVSPVFAQPTPVSAPEEGQQDPYMALVDLFHTLDAGNLVFERQMAQLRDVWLGTPEFAQVEVACPGMVDAVLFAVKPVFREMDERSNRQLRNALRGIFAANITPQEAQEATAFFQSPDGQVLIGAVLNNVTMETALTEAMTTGDGAFSRESMARDKHRTSAAAVRSIDPETQDRIAATLTAAPWFPKLMALRPQMDNARYTIFNAPLTSREQAQIDAVIGPAMDAHLETCI